jgi:hypothetical protein
MVATTGTGAAAETREIADVRTVAIILGFSA